MLLGFQNFTKLALEMNRLKYKSKYLFLVVLGILIGSIFSIIPQKDSFGFIFILFISCILLLIAIQYPSIAQILFLAFFLRLILVIYSEYVSFLPEYLGSDAQMFESYGWEYAQSGLLWLIRNFKTGALFYSWIIGLIYSFIGRNQFVVELLNVLFGILIVLNVYKIVLLLYDKRSAYIASLIAAFFPSLIYFSAVILRDVVIIYSLSLGLLFFFQWKKFHKAKNVFLSFVFFAISFAFHTGMLVFIIVFLFLVFKDLFNKSLREPVRKNSMSFLLLIFMLIFFVAMIKTGWGMEKVGSLQYLSLSKLAEIEKIAARGRSAYLIDLQISSIGDLLWQTPVRVFYFLFGPFVWRLHSILDLIGFFDAILYLILFIIIFRSFCLLFKYDVNRDLFLFLFFGILVFALTVSNYGTALRHRAKFLPLLDILVVGIFYIRRNSKNLPVKKRRSK